MNTIFAKNTLPVTVVGLALLAASNASAVGLCPDNFEDMGLQNWNDGGSVNMPVNVSGGPPGSSYYIERITPSFGGSPGSKISLVNRMQWTGDYVAAGVNEIRAHVLVEASPCASLTIKARPPLPPPYKCMTCSTSRSLAGVKSDASSSWT